MGSEGLEKAALKLRTPCHVIDLTKLEDNCRILSRVQEKAGCKILLALKAFSCHAAFPAIKKYLAGTEASGLFEAKLGREFGKQVHVYSPAFSPEDMPEILKIADHIVFNSFAQWKRYKALVGKSKRKISCGIRVNPEYSEIKMPLYNPCIPGSRFGVLASDMQPLDGLEGLHFHTLCEQGADALQNTIPHLEKRFERELKEVKWVNFGGGHHITRKDYDVKLLVRIIKDFKRKWNVEVYIEPGEAIALDAGIMTATVLDIVQNEKDIAILDTSAIAHVPDVIFTCGDYRAIIEGAGVPGEKKHLYRIAGQTCAAGDIFGDYSFDRKLKVGDKLVFRNMAIYNMTQTSMFNGINSPSIALWDGKKLKVVREFGFVDYRKRLG